MNLFDLVFNATEFDNHHYDLVKMLASIPGFSGMRTEGTNTFISFTDPESRVTFAAKARPIVKFMATVSYIQ